MKNPSQLFAGEVRPFLFFVGMCFMALCFSVVVCSSLFYALNLTGSSRNDAKVAQLDKLTSVKKIFTYAVK